MTNKTETTTFKLDDSVIAHIVKLIQLGFLQGLDVVDYFRQIVLIEENSQLHLEANYANKIQEEIDHLLAVAETQSSNEESVNESE